MKKNLILAICFFFISSFVHASDFITRWDLSYPTGSSLLLNQISFNTVTSGIVSYTWETIPASTSGSGTFTGGKTIITGLPTDAIIRLHIDSTNFNQFNMYHSNDNQRLVDVQQWGSIVWTSMSDAFYDCSHLNISATDIPNLSSVNNMSSIFSGCSSLNTLVNCDNWNTSNVTNMANAFYNASSFNQPIGNWNTSNVTNMANAFCYASSFNQPLGNWNTSNVTDMSNMFFRATSFNQPIGNWNTTNVTNMSLMFSQTSFNQPLENWNTSSVTDMSSMFSQTSFNQPIGNWNTENVTEMSGMFSDATSFNQPIENWNTANVIYMNSMFENAIHFNQPIGNWNTSKVIDLGAMFYNATSFNQPINNWNTNNVYMMSEMFSGASSFNQPIRNWNTSQVNNMALMFNYATSFNQPIGNWNTISVVYIPKTGGGSSKAGMNGMFNHATSFNQPIGNWIINSTILDSMLDYSGMDCSNYSSTLAGWAANTSIHSGIKLGAVHLHYGTNARADRDYLMENKGWNINGDIADNNYCFPLTGTNGEHSNFISDSPLTLRYKEHSNFISNFYPNPSTTFSSIDLYYEEKKEVSLKVFTILGNLIFQDKIKTPKGKTTYTLSRENIANGVYSIVISVNNDQVVKKLSVCK